MCNFVVWIADFPLLPMKWHTSKFKLSQWECQDGLFVFLPKTVTENEWNLKINWKNVEEKLLVENAPILPVTECGVIEGVVRSWRQCLKFKRPDYDCGDNELTTRVKCLLYRIFEH